MHCSKCTKPNRMHHEVDPEMALMFGQFFSGGTPGVRDAP
jgi:hypothetical protein